MGAYTSARFAAFSLCARLVLAFAFLLSRGTRVARGSGRGRAERPLARETLAEGRAQNEPKFIRYSLHYLGDCALWRGEPEKAVPIYCDSLRAALDYGNQMEASTEMQGIAMGLAGSGKEQEALRLYGASCARNKELQTTATDEIAFWLELRKRYLVPARERVGATAAERAEAEGRSMGWAQAVAHALELAQKGNG